MKNTISDLRQLFNIKKLADAGLTPNNIPDGQFAIVDDDTNLTVLPADFSELPNNFKLISKLDGKVYFSYDTIDKTCCKLDSALAKEYQSPTTQCWETIIDFCDCINTFQLNVAINEASLMLRDGLTWAHKDSIVDVSPDELSCQCNCTCTGTLKVYQNNIITTVLAAKINELNSPYYYAEVRNADDDTVITDIPTFLAANEAINTDTDDTNDGPMLKLVLCTKIQPTPDYNNIEVNYVYPRGVNILPNIVINGQKSISFTKLSDFQYEIGAGYDLRAEEWENMNHYTNLNYFTRLSDGLPSSNIKYQFENGGKYNTVTFEFDSKKSGLEDVFEGRYKRFIVILGTEDISIFNTLVNIFVQP